jgi:GNAT superfamily N-acetyltransferase
MKWLPDDQMLAGIRLAPGFRVEKVQRSHIPTVISRLRDWYPEMSHGVSSCYLRESFYDQRVCLDRDDEKDVQVLTIWSGDEMAGVWSVEREADSSALWGRLVVIAPEHGGKGLSRQMVEGMEHAGRRMGAAFMYALVTLKHSYMQRMLEHADYRLLGFFPGYDRELVAPGVVKRVYQAVYAKLLVPEDKVLRPDPANMTPGAASLFKVLFPD